MASPVDEMRAALEELSPPWEDVVRLVQDHGKDVLEVVTGPDKDSALHIASFWGEVEAIEALLNAGADPKALNRRKATALHIAAMNGQKDAAKALVARGLDMSVCDEEGNQPLHTACTVGDVAMVTTLLELGADPLGRSAANGGTPCHVAARDGFVDVCKELVNKAGSSVLSAVNDAEEQPLHRAAAHGQRDVVTALVKLGADHGAMDSNGDQPLHLAAMFGMPETASELISLGATVDAIDEDGQTPLHLACTFKQSEVACILIKLGADVGKTNEEGESPRNIAKTNTLTDVVNAMT